MGASMEAEAASSEAGGSIPARLGRFKVERLPGGVRLRGSRGTFVSRGAALRLARVFGLLLLAAGPAGWHFGMLPGVLATFPLAVVLLILLVLAGQARAYRELAVIEPSLVEIGQDREFHRGGAAGPVFGVDGMSMPCGDVRQVQVARHPDPDGDDDYYTVDVVTRSLFVELDQLEAGEKARALARHVHGWLARFAPAVVLQAEPAWRNPFPAGPLVGTLTIGAIALCALALAPALLGLDPPLLDGLAAAAGLILYDLALYALFSRWLRRSLRRHLSRQHGIRPD